MTREEEETEAFSKSLINASFTVSDEYDEFDGPDELDDEGILP